MAKRLSNVERVVKRGAYLGTNDEYIFQGYSAAQWANMGRSDIARVLDKLTNKKRGNPLPFGKWLRGPFRLRRNGRRVLIDMRR